MEKIERMKLLDFEKILDKRFELLYLGKEAGSFKPTDENFYEKINTVRKEAGLTYIFAPSLNFTKRTGSLSNPLEKGFVVGASGTPEKYADEGVLRTLEKADGGIIFLDDLAEAGLRPDEIALAGFNADCPFIIGYESEKKAMFMLHAGLGCLRKFGEMGKQTIFENMVKEYGLQPDKIKIFVTAGIQKCCYGRSDQVFPDVFEEWGMEFKDIATEGERTGQISLDLSGLIEADLKRVGVPTENISVDKQCTCCDGKHWSNVKGDSERNLVLVKPVGL
jgi:hypothetical protein